ncbi:YkgJ family cysteine cluster protein [Thermodesulfobacteriota bacterium]
MAQDQNKKCPFVTKSGCNIYEDRPGACRIYPLGRASLKVDGEKDAREKFFIVKETHCLGFLEDQDWTLDEWTAHEGIDEFNAMNDQWLEIITSQKSLGSSADLPRKMQMFSMASYNLDQFRKFIFKSKFFEHFEVDRSLRDQLANNDIRLLEFAIDWLKLSLFGEKTIKIKHH